MQNKNINVKITLNYEFGSGSFSTAELCYYTARTITRDSHEISAENGISLVLCYATYSNPYTFKQWQPHSNHKTFGSLLFCTAEYVFIYNRKKHTIPLTQATQRLNLITTNIHSSF
jgi:hypothetical protein